MPPLKREVLARLPNARYQPRPKAVGCMPKLDCLRGLVDFNPDLRRINGYKVSSSRPGEKPYARAKHQNAILRIVLE